MSQFSDLSTTVPSDDYSGPGSLRVEEQPFALVPEWVIDEAVEMIDVGGLSLLGAAARNFGGVAAVCDASDYPALVPLPEPSEGPHRGYAVQWFLFAAVTVVGYPVLLFGDIRHNIPKDMGQPSCVRRRFFSLAFAGGTTGHSI